MYPTFSDTQRCIWNNKAILAQVVVEWKMKQQNIYPQNIKIGFSDLSNVHINRKYLKTVDH